MAKDIYSFYTVFFALSNAIFFAFLILRRNTISNKIRYILYAAFTLHTLLLWISSVPFGQRGGIISPLLFWFLIYTHRKKNINLNFLPLFALGIIVGLVALQTIRDANFSGIADIDVISSIISGYGGFGERLITYAEVYANVPGLLDFQYGKTYLTLFTQFIPRDIWPDKWDTAGYLITKNVTADWATSQRANTQGTLFGEAFLNFSHLGLIIVPIVYGSCVNFIEQHYLKNHDVWCLVKYAILALSFLFMITGDFVNTMFGALISWFVISILEFFSKQRIYVYKTK